MTTKGILLAVTEPQQLADVNQALGAGWEIVSAETETEALAQLEARAFEALLVDFNLGSPDASELLNQAGLKRPETICFILAHEADLALIAAKVEGSPNILPKPIESASLKTRIEEAVTASKPQPTQTDQADASIATPAVPSIYTEVLKALESPGISTRVIGNLIARDPALKSELLRLTNSTHLGLPRNVTDPVEAVELLGLEVVKALIQALQFMAEHSQLRAGYLSVDKLWQHSINVAQIARDLVLFETKDRSLASQALIAGLLHDLGKIVLATNFDDLYGRVHSLARKQPIALGDIEKEMFGASHGEIGACLLGMWNLPAAVVDAAAMHHEPQLSIDQQLTPLAAVHIANILEHELRPADNDVMVAPIINTPFLNQLGLLQRLPIWRAAFANRRSESFETEMSSLEAEQVESSAGLSTSASRTGNYLPGPANATQTGTSGQPGDPAQKQTQGRTWAYVSVALGVLLLLVVWLKTEPDLNTTDSAYARTPAPSPAVPGVAESSATPQQKYDSTSPEAAATPSLPPDLQSPTTSAPAGSDTTVAPAVAATTPVATTPAAANEPNAALSSKVPETSVTAPEPPAAAASTPAVTNVAVASTHPQQKPQPDFRLNAIFYTTVRPSAILNGETVNIGDELNGATVVSITRTAVTLTINGHRKTLELR